MSNGSEVSINSVNNGVVGSYGGSPSASKCTAANPSWVNGTSTAEFKGPIYGIQFNGNTKVLTASQSGLTPGSTYHIKLIITDANDGAYDSGVFIEAGSFSSPVTLPVTLIDFKGDCDNKGIQLNWSTASEKDNQRFVVERSEDGINFKRIGEIPGSVSTNNIKHYFFNDQNPNAGLNYYRLKQQDFNGELTVFKTISVDALCLNQQELELSLYPNPVNQDVSIDFNLNDDTDMSFEVVNSMGQIVKYIYEKRYEKGFQNISIDVISLSSGVYYFKTHSNMKVKVLKFIKL